jgi:NTP pyrophosphatase (non-canonical NTP hydrolase)
MKLDNEFQPIRDWARQRGLYDKGDIKTQTLKLQEEAGELSAAIIKDDHAGIRDAIGDIAVVLTSVAWFAGMRVEDCINAAYQEIASRTGEMRNGSFQKDNNV